MCVPAACALVRGDRGEQEGLPHVLQVGHEGPVSAGGHRKRAHFALAIGGLDEQDQFLGLVPGGGGLDAGPFPEDDLLAVLGGL